MPRNFFSVIQEYVCICPLKSFIFRKLYTWFKRFLFTGNVVIESTFGRSPRFIIWNSLLREGLIFSKLRNSR